MAGVKRIPEPVSPSVSKVVYGGKILVDLTADDVTEDCVKSGVMFHRADGCRTRGSLYVPKVETRTIDLDMSSGNQTIKANSDKVMSSVTITKPDTMVPENIKKDVNIGGVAGTLTVPAIQPSKSLTITSNGTVSVTPDVPYDALKKVNVTVDVVGGQDEYVEAALISNVKTNFPATYKNTIATKVKPVCFNGYTELISVEFPMVTDVGIQAFQNCTRLEKADFSVLTHIDQWAFNVCRALKALIIRTNSVCTLAGTNAFANNSGIMTGKGYVYVPSTLVNDYKSAINWSTYADQIRAIEDYPSITGG